MATWESRSALQVRFEADHAVLARHEIPQMLVAGLTVLVIAAGPWVFRAEGPSSARMTPARVGALEAPRPMRSVVTTRAIRSRQTLRIAFTSSGNFLVTFGRFERRESAEAHARLVRSKWYIAKIMQSGGAHLVVSRPYRTLADAQFWSAIFGEIGLEAGASSGLEAGNRQSIAPGL